jgi:hypothetical protein
MRDVARILEVAAMEVEKGWTQGTFEDLQNNVCVLGAIDRATADQPDQYQVLRWAGTPPILVLARYLKIHPLDIGVWNDRLPSGSKGQQIVAKTLRDAAEAYRRSLTSTVVIVHEPEPVTA